MSLVSASVTDSLGLPPAPAMFGGTDWGAQVDNSLSFFFGAPAPADDGPPPDPTTVYCPEGCSLYPYQEDGVQYLLDHPIALLGDEMGLGKAIQAIAAMRLLIHQGKTKEALILCPKSLLYDWRAKLKQWAPDLRVRLIEGPRERHRFMWNCPYEIHVTVSGYESWRDDLRLGFVDPDRFNLVILDEVQRIKNPKSVLHKAVARLQPEWRWGLSGTPLENCVEEIEAIFAFLKPRLLPGKATPAAIQTAIAPYVLRRRKVDVLTHLPPKENRTVWIDLTPEQRALYDETLAEAQRTMRSLDRSAASMVALQHITKLKLICNLEPSSGASSKMDFMEAELERLVRENAKALVFSQYPEKTLKPLLPRLERYGAAVYDGNLSDWNRQLMVEWFQKKDVPRVLALSLKCGGVGITLTRANHVYHFDYWWNASAAQQAEDRTHRIGQDKPVYVTTIMTKGTIEERIAEIVAEKQALIESMMDPLTDFEAAEEVQLGKLLTHEDLMRVLGAH